MKTGNSVYSFLWEPITELRSVTCHMGSHSIICYPTQVNAPRLNPHSRAGRYLWTSLSASHVYIASCYVDIVSWLDNITQWSEKDLVTLVDTVCLAERRNRYQRFVFGAAYYYYYYYYY